MASLTYGYIYIHTGPYSNSTLHDKILDMNIPDSQVHGSNSEQWESMHLDHDEDKGHIQYHPDQTCTKIEWKVFLINSN